MMEGNVLDGEWRVTILTDCANRTGAADCGDFLPSRTTTRVRRMRRESCPSVRLNTGAGDPVPPPA